VQVQWSAVDPNGAGQPTYTVTRNGQPVCTNTPATSCTDNPASGQTYTYSVVAANEAGHRSPAASTTFKVEGTPDAPGGMSANPTNNDGELDVGYVAPNPNGQESTIHCTSSTAGSCGTWDAGPPGSTQHHTVSGLGKDADVTITLQDCNAQYCGAPASATGHTNGPPKAPSVGCSRSGQTITWNWNRPNAINGHAVRFNLSGATSAKNSNATGYSHQFPQDGNDHTLTVQSVDDRGETGGSDSATCTDAPKPDPPTIAVNPGAWTTTVPGCTGHGCHAVHVVLSHFQPNQTVTLTKVWTPATSQTGPMTVTTDGNGGWDGTYDYYGGGSNGTGPGRVTVSGGQASGTCFTNWADANNHSCN
jgi:hypothetical protein